MSETYTLRPFQQEVVDRFVHRKDVRNVLIGDDMGLGKTYEAIALDWERRKKDRSGVPWRPTLVITTKSMVPTWEETYEAALPNLRVVSLDPKARLSYLGIINSQAADVYIMHWDAVRLMPEMREVKWFHIIGDEVHKIKNRKAQVTTSLKKLRAFYKTGLSGTPADNKPHDLWSILHWLYPQEFRSYWRFYKTYVDAEQDFNGYYKVKGVKNVEHLHREIAPFYIRRRKEEVLKDLPPKYYNTLWVDLTPTQRRMYNGMRKDMLAWIGQQDQSKPLPAPNVAVKLQRLQQFSSATMDSELAKRWVKNPVFDPDLPEVPLDQVCDWQYDNWRRRQVEFTRYFMIDPSAKIDAAMALLEDSNEPVVFFSQFKQMVNLFRQRLEAAGISHGILTGDTSQADRADLIRNFQAGKLQVFAGTIAAGGVGITLTRSSHVVFFDRAWSPSWNRQAEDRLHRISQENAVQVTDIMAKNTIDAGRAQSIQDKWTWLQQILGDKTLDYQKGILHTNNNQSFLNGIIHQIG